MTLVDASGIDYPSKNYLKRLYHDNFFIQVLATHMYSVYSYTLQEFQVLKVSKVRL